MIERNIRYLLFGSLVFVVCTIVSYKIFRHGELRVFVKLANVKFQDELPRSVDLEGPLSPIQKWDVELKQGGKLSRYLAKTGDVIKKEQLIAILDEEENKASLLGALAAFKSEKGNVEAAKAKLHAGSLTQKEFEEGQAKYFTAKSTLERAKETLEASLIRSPAEGRLFLKNVKPGDPVRVGSTLAEIEDWSKILVPVEALDSDSHDIPNHCRVFITSPEGPATQKPVETVAEVHAADARTSSKPNQASLDLVLQSNDDLGNWRHQTVRLNIPLKSYKQVALVERRAIFSKGGESKIPVLNPYGFLHWQRVNGAPVFEDRIVIKGVNAKSFRVVIPDEPELLTKAITYNVKPKVENGG